MRSATVPGYSLGFVIPGLGASITYQSTPDYDGWGFDSYWTCDEWKNWHIALVKQYGLARANELWVEAWNKQDTFEHGKNVCKYNTEFVNYLLSKGIDIRSFVSAIFTNVAETVVNTTEAAADLSDNLDWIVPAAIGAALLIGGLILYSQVKT